MPVHCIYGTESETDEAYVYDVPHFTSATPPAPRDIVMGPGDGTVNLRSLAACEQLGPQARPESPHLLVWLAHFSQIWRLRWRLQQMPCGCAASAHKTSHCSIVMCSTPHRRAV